MRKNPSERERERDIERRKEIKGRSSPLIPVPIVKHQQQANINDQTS